MRTLFRFVDNLPISRKFMLLIGMILLGIGSVAAVGLSTASILNISLNRAVTVDLVAVRNLTLGDMMHDGLRAVALRTIVAAQLGDAQEVKDAVEEYKEFSANFRKYMDIVEPLPTSPEFKQAFADMKPDLEEYIASTEAMVNLAAQGRPETALQQYGDYQKVFKKLEVSLGKLGDIGETSSNKHLEETQSKSENAPFVIFWSSVLTVVLTGGVSFLITRSIQKPVASILPVLKSVASGDLSRNAHVASTDELGQIAAALNISIDAMRASVSLIERKNAEMSQILNHTEQGFVTLNNDGTMGAEHSAIVSAWFGEYDGARRFWDFLASGNKKWAGVMEFAWEQVTSDFLPIDLAIDQLPRRFEKDGMEFRLEFKPIVTASGALEKTLLVISDDTVRVAQEVAEKESKETMKIFQCLMKDRAGFLGFIAETEKVIRGLFLPGLSHEDVKRYIHTVKGNTAIYGLFSVAEYCHAWETKLVDQGMDSTNADKQKLLDLWNAKIAQMQTFLTTKGSSSLEIDEKEYNAALEIIRGSDDLPTIRQTIESWKYESTHVILRRIKDQAESLAERLGKPGIRVEVDHNFIRIDQSVYQGLWSSLVHVIRNSIDHGIEAPQDRLAAGKSQEGNVSLKTYWTRKQEFCIEVSDDGAGIQWDRISRKAAALGLPHATKDDLVSALFADGISTRDAITEVSGRGVGMGAVQTECARLSGRIEIESAPGEGTTFRFLIPSGLRLVA